MIIYFFVIVGAAVLGFSPFVVAVPRFMKQPSITEVGAYAGWTDVGDRYRMTRTVLGATAYSPLGSAEGDRFGVEFGVAYRQTEDIWYCDYVCIDEYEVDDGETLKGFIEASVLNRWNVAASDGADLYLLAGTSLATQATCLRRNHTLGTEEACTTRETDVRLVVRHPFGVSGIPSPRRVRQPALRSVSMGVYAGGNNGRGLRSPRRYVIPGCRLPPRSGAMSRLLASSAHLL